MSGEPILTFIVLACHLNVAPLKREEANFEKPPKGCQVIEQEILMEEMIHTMTPMGCMMQSPVMVAKFMEQHPGLEPRKWTCKYIRPYAKI